MTRALALALAACLALACRREPGSPGLRPGADAASPPPIDLGEVRRAIAGCPVPLTDAALDDLATYGACTLPRAVVALVRNDQADDELDLPDLALLRRHAGRLPRALFEAQLRRFADPRGLLEAYVQLDRERDLLRPDPVLAPGVEVPFAPGPPAPPDACGPAGCAGRLVPPPHPERPYRAERRAALRAVATAARPLAGVRVGLDPGHAGGPFARLEGRQVAYQAPSPGAPQVLLQEGDLTLRTALELRDKLAADGADVVLTRDRPSLVAAAPLHALRPAAERLLRHLALDPTFDALSRALAAPDRLRLHSAVAVLAVSRRARFESLRARARLLAAAGVDLALSIHFNAAPPGGRHGGEELVAMVRGFPDQGRLYNPYHRWRALEGAFAVEDFDAAAHLGALCVHAMSARLGVPVARSPRYPDHLPVRGPDGAPLGVDAWDGVLLRYLDGVAILTEGPDVDDRDEMPRLAAALASPPGTPGTRTERYADALAACVREFARRWLDSDRNPFARDPEPQPAVAHDAAGASR